MKFEDIRAILAIKITKVIEEDNHSFLIAVGVSAYDGRGELLPRPL